MHTVPLDRVIRRWPTPGSREWLASFLDRAEHDANIRAVVAVGSAIRSDVTSDDLDIVALCRDRTQLRERAPIEVDLRSFDLDQVERGLREGEDLLTWSVRFGCALLDRDRTWESIVDHWKDHLSLPDASVARARASTARTQLEDMSRVGDEDAMVDLRVSYLSHLGRAVLVEGGVYPASRPELPEQLRRIGQSELADELQDALTVRAERHTADTAV